MQVVIAFILQNRWRSPRDMLGAVWGTLLDWLGPGHRHRNRVFIRKIGVVAVEAFFPREKIDSVKHLNNEKALNATAFILFLIPGTPKDLLSHVAGLTKDSPAALDLLTSIAWIPSVVTSTISGNALDCSNTGLPSSSLRRPRYIRCRHPALPPHA
ncbi:MAG: hypothetical protein R2912_05100 [Eubacteriales bacterium]